MSIHHRLCRGAATLDGHDVRAVGVWLDPAIGTREERLMGHHLERRLGADVRDLGGISVSVENPMTA